MVDGWAQLHLQRGEHQLAKVVLDATGSDVVSRGSGARRNSFYRHLAWQRVLQDGGRVDDDAIAYVQRPRRLLSRPAKLR